MIIIIIMIMTIMMIKTILILIIVIIMGGNRWSDLFLRGNRKGTNGVSTNGVTANFSFCLTEGLFGHSR